MSNVSHCPAIDDGVDGGIEEHKSKRELLQDLKSYTFACLYLMYNPNEVPWQITNPKCEIDPQRTSNRFSETRNFNSVAVL